MTRSDKDKNETYTGLTNNICKTRFTAHTSSFKNVNRKYPTALNQYIWTMKEQGIAFNIEWKLIARAKSYSLATADAIVFERKVIHNFPGTFTKFYSMNFF